MRIINSGLKLAFLAVALTASMNACKKKTPEGATSETKSTEAASGKKVFNYFRSNAHKSMDPMKQFDTASGELVSSLYDTLFEYHYLKRPYQLVPLLLEKMPTKKPETNTYQFNLKKGVKFSDDEAFPEGKGRECNADDVVYSIKRWADANTNQLTYILGRGFVQGMDEFREKSQKEGAKFDISKNDISGVKKTGSHSFEITFTRDNPLALFIFAHASLSIVPKEAVDKYGEDFANHPVGTGPFTIKEYNRRGTIVLAKNENYHQTYPTEGSEEDKAKGLLKDAGKKVPFIDEITLPLIEESQPAMLKFKKGELDLIGMDKDNFETMALKDKDGNFRLNDEYAKKYDMYAEPHLAFEYYSFNLKDPVVGISADPEQNKKNKALRQAFAYALNVENYINVLRNGRGLKLNTPVPHPIAGSEKDIDFKYYEYNVEMAKKKLAEAGYPEGKGLPEIAIEYRSTTKQIRQNFEMIRSELAAIGIKAKGNFQTFSSFLKKTEKGNFQMANSGWVADYPDAENFYQLLYGPNKSPGPNESNFNNSRYNELYEKSRFMVNGPERFAIFKEMAGIIKEDVPVLIRFNSIVFGVHQKNIRNLKRNLMMGFPAKFFNKD